MIVKVPATTANLGPGFDSLGMALDLYNTYDFELLEDGKVEVLARPPYNNERNLVYLCFKKTLELLEKSVSGVRLTVDTQIPICRGLGSSASCIVGGILGAFLLSETPIDLKQVLEIATSFEGHPDNVAPAIFGGLVASVMTETGQVYKTQVNMKNEYDFITIVPNFKLSTAVSREALPKTLNFQDAVYNVGRVALLIGALQNGEDESLKEALNDKLHQNYRKILIRGYERVSNFLREKTLGVCLSGAGPTILAVVKPNQEEVLMEIQQYMKKTKPNWEVNVLKINKTGAIY